MIGADIENKRRNNGNYSDDDVNIEVSSVDDDSANEVDEDINNCDDENEYLSPRKRPTADEMQYNNMDFSYAKELQASKTTRSDHSNAKKQYMNEESKIDRDFAMPAVALIDTNSGE